MFARLRENLGLKILATALSIVLRLFVAAQQNPIQTRQVTLTVSPRYLPEYLLLASKSLTTTVSLSGTVEDLNRAQESISASVDLHSAHPGVNPGVPISVDLASTHGVTITTVQPRTISVQVVARVHARMPIVVATAGTSAIGYAPQRPSVVPSMATVIGAADRVAEVARLVVRPDVTGATDTVDDDFPISALDAQGAEVSDVHVSPDTAHVKIGIVPTAQTKEVFIVPEVAGYPAAGYLIGAVTVSPRMAVLSGRMEALSTIGSIGTDPIAVDGATADITRNVRCLPPAGTSLDSGTTATVHIAVRPVIQPQPPAPTPGPGPTPPATAPERSQSRL
ncbi:MAG: YbbR-like domain-containing protein [Capsulimonadaceae bacterium]